MLRERSPSDCNRVGGPICGFIFSFRISSLVPRVGQKELVIDIHQAIAIDIGRGLGCVPRGRQLVEITFINLVRVVNVAAGQHAGADEGHGQSLAQMHSEHSGRTRMQFEWGNSGCERE